MSKVLKGVSSIQRLRESKGWSQETLAKAAGIATRTVQRIENGEKGAYESLLSIAAALNCDVEALKAVPDEIMFPLNVSTIRATIQRTEEWAIKIPENLESPIPLETMRRKISESIQTQSLLDELNQLGWQLVGRDFKMGGRSGFMMMAVPKNGAWSAKVKVG